MVDDDSVVLAGSVCGMSAACECAVLAVLAVLAVCPLLSSPVSQPSPTASTLDAHTHTLTTVS